MVLNIANNTNYFLKCQEDICENLFEDVKRETIDVKRIVIWFFFFLHSPSHTSHLTLHILKIKVTVFKCP